jgi:uncharacterized protein YaeQ
MCREPLLALNTMLNATIYNFDIDLADHDKSRFETLAVRVAKHPSESDEYLVARVLAYCLEYDEGIAFSKGVSDPDEPAITVRDLTGALRAWIEIGTPDAARLHRAAKTAPRVVAYCHKDPAQWLRQLAGERMHRAEAVELRAFAKPLITGLASRLSRRMSQSVSIADQHLTVAVDDVLLEGVVTTLELPHR